jgi:hypothetical protein
LHYPSHQRRNTLGRPFASLRCLSGSGREDVQNKHPEKVGDRESEEPLWRDLSSPRARMRFYVLWLGGSRHRPAVHQPD